jgi:hypothetical protein
MPITLDALTVNFQHVERERLLEDWRWLIGPCKQPILVAAIGDAFLQDEDDGTVWVLDVGTPELFQVAESFEAFRAQLADRDFVMDHFAVEVVVSLQEQGSVLAPGQVYSLRHPPFAGGAFALDNLEPCDVSVHFSTLGQLAERAQDLPEGTQVDKVELSSGDELIVSAFTRYLNGDDVDDREDLLEGADFAAGFFLHRHEADTARAVGLRLRAVADDRADALLARIEESSLRSWTGDDEEWRRFQEIARRIADQIDAARA